MVRISYPGKPHRKQVPVQAEPWNSIVLEPLCPRSGLWSIVFWRAEGKK